MEDFDKKSVMETFELMAERLDNLDGMFGLWDREIELVREALERAGYT